MFDLQLHTFGHNKYHLLIDLRKIGYELSFEMVYIEA